MIIIIIIITIIGINYSPIIIGVQLLKYYYSNIGSC